MSRIGFTRSKKTFMGPNLPRSVKTKEIDVSHNLVVRRIYLYQEDQVIAFFNHFYEGHRFEEFIGGPAFLLVSLYADMIISRGARKCEIIGKLTGHRTPIVLLETCIICFYGFFFLCVLCCSPETDTVQQDQHKWQCNKASFKLFHDHGLFK